MTASEKARKQRRPAPVEHVGAYFGGDVWHVPDLWWTYRAFPAGEIELAPRTGPEHVPGISEQVGQIVTAARGGLFVDEVAALANASSASLVGFMRQYGNLSPDWQRQRRELYYIDSDELR